MWHLIKKQWNNCCWEERINNKEVSGKYGDRQWKKTSPKNENEKANKVKDEPKLNVDEQQEAIQLLKEYFDIDDIDPNKKKRLFV